MRARERLQEVLRDLAVAQTPVELVRAVAVQGARHLDADAAVAAGVAS